MESMTDKVTDNTIDSADNRQLVHDMIQSLTANELIFLLASIQCKIVDEFDNNEYSIAPDYVTKSECKQLIKAIREKQSKEDTYTRQRGNRIIAHIRNVWIPQIMQRKAG